MPNQRYLLFRNNSQKINISSQKVVVEIKKETISFIEVYVLKELKTNCKVEFLSYLLTFKI